MTLFESRLRVPKRRGAHGTRDMRVAQDAHVVGDGCLGDARAKARRF